MNKTVKNAVYYNYEGDSLIITRNNQGGNEDCVEIEAYRCAGGKTDGLALFMSMTISDWETLTHQVDFLLLNKRTTSSV